MFHVFDNVMYLLDCQNKVITMCSLLIVITWICILGRQPYIT